MLSSWFRVTQFPTHYTKSHWWFLWRSCFSICDHCKGMGFTLPPLSDGHTHVGVPCVHSCTRNKFVAVKVSHYKQCCPTILTHSSCDSLVCSHMQTVVFVQATMKWNWEWVFSSQVYCRADSFNHCCLPITHVATDSLIWCVHDLGTGVSSWLSAYSLAVLLKVMCKTSCWK